MLSVVAPVFNEADGVGAFYDRLKSVLVSLPDLEHEIVFVDDGSTDGSYERLRRLADADPRVRLLKLSRNFGHQAAITAGIDHAQGHAVAIIDSDLQDPPEVIPAFLEKWREGFDVVYGVRRSRGGETRLKLWTASLYYRLLKRLVNLDIPVDVGDFRLLSKRAADQLRALREHDRYVRGLVTWIGFRQAGVLYERQARVAGETKYPLRKMLKFALDGVTSFSTMPLKLATWLGYLSSGLAFLYMLSVFVQKWQGGTVQGWATTMVSILFIGGVQLICLGIVGEYVGRIFNEIKQRPLYVVEEVHSARAPGGQGGETPLGSSSSGPRASRHRAYPDA